MKIDKLDKQILEYLENAKLCIKSWPNMQNKMALRLFGG